jgi:hypothetical protein
VASRFSLELIGEVVRFRGELIGEVVSCSGGTIGMLRRRSKWRNLPQPGNDRCSEKHVLCTKMIKNDF